MARPVGLVWQIGAEWQYRQVRRVIRYRVTVLNQWQPLVAQVADRVGALVYEALDHYENLQRQFDDDWILSVTLSSPDRVELLQRPFGTHRYFRGVEDIVDNLAQAILTAIDNLAQSEGYYDIEDLIFEMRFDRGHPQQPARGRQPKYLLNSLGKEVKGLYKLKGVDMACGYKSIVVLMAAEPLVLQRWTGDLEWFYEKFPHRIPSVKALHNVPQRLLELAVELARQLGVTEEPYEWEIGAINSTAQKFIATQPRLQIVLFNEITKQVREQRYGVHFDADVGPTLMLSSTHGHLAPVKSARAYFGKSNNDGLFCHYCLRLAPINHVCNGKTFQQCTKCRVVFDSAEMLKNHKNGPPVWCQGCEREFFNLACHDLHCCHAETKPRCDVCGRVEHPDRECFEYKCMTCNELVGIEHNCALVVPEMPEPLEPEIAGANYYAFDCEALLEPVGDATLHTVNLVIVQRCFSNEPQRIFDSLGDFIDWVESVDEPSEFFAHNLKGYDGRLVFEYLMDERKAPQSMMWVGSKILQMCYGKHKFRDTLPHLTASLAQLPKMLGLDERQFKKGFFPYLFNIPENQAYVGPIPPHYEFDPDSMSPSKRDEFERWYREQTGEYNFHRELVEYCASDVKILAAAIEAYMRQMMASIPFNPFLKMTSAGYAKDVFMLYHLPPNMLFRLRSHYVEKIRPSMHGGRTDTRRLLKEWTADEIARGFYGKYQDVQSLYPTVQFYDPMPVGVPRYKEFVHKDGTWALHPQPTVAELFEVFGFVCCDIECRERLFHPIIVETLADGRLVADLRPKKMITIPTPELHLALRHGYVVTKVYWWLEFDQSTDLFKSYFRTFLKAKLNASGVPKWVRNEEQWREFADYHKNELGIELRREEMVSNPSAKTGAKILCNSLWGKFGQRLGGAQNAVYDVEKDVDKILANERNWIDGKIDIQYTRYDRNDTQLFMVYKWANDNAHPPPKWFVAAHNGQTHIALASMVTSHARCRLWAEMHKLGKRVLYHDTDSIIYEHQPDAYNIPEGRYLGEWECETGGVPIVKFVSTGPKCYSYQTADGKSVTKAKGITLNSANSTLIHYDSMKDLVLDNLDSIETKCVLFQYDRRRGLMVTRNVLKLFQKTLTKGRVDASDWTVYPFE